MMKWLLLGLAALLPDATLAHNHVALVSDVFVEKPVKDQAGRTKLILEEPKIVVPGDRLVFVLKYQNNGQAPATNFIVTNPLPPAVQFEGAVDNGAQVSVDGGRSWGALATLKVKDGSSVRFAHPGDVTHIRWTFANPIPVGSAGKLMFRGIVR